MPVDPVIAAFNGISLGLLTVGVALLVFTLAAAGICMYFAWFDTHIGGFIKRILIASLGGSTLLGGSGALGVWLGGLFGLHGAAPAAGAPAGMILGLFGLL
jgi:hypothetical protein